MYIVTLKSFGEVDMCGVATNIKALTEIVSKTYDSSFESIDSDLSDKKPTYTDLCKMFKDRKDYAKFTKVFDIWSDNDTADLIITYVGVTNKFM